MSRNSLYIYLARRDKRGMKVISGFNFKGKAYATRVEDISRLGLSPQVSALVSKEAYENRMEYELFIESAESFDDLKLSLHNRGYSNLPLQQFTGYVGPTNINTNALVTTKSTMIRRNSDLRR
jgi:hypothetical protein